MPVFMHQISQLIAWMALAATLVALSVVAGAHVITSPRLAAWADAMSPTSGHFLIGCIGATLAVMISRHALPILGATLLFATLIHPAAHFAQQTSTSQAAAADVSAHGLRVYAHNTWDRHPDLEHLENALLAVKADVLVLIEVDPAKQLLLQRLAKRYPYSVPCANQSPCTTAILSRFPIQAGRADRANGNMPPVSWARIDATDAGLGLVTVAGTHVHRPTLNPMLHRRQMQALAQLVLPIQGPLILAGDFNAGPWSASFRDLLSMKRLTSSGTLLPTWPMAPVALPQFAIDHILVTADLTVTRSGTAPATGSDHAALYAEIRLKDRTKTSMAMTTTPERDRISVQRLAD